ncbi:Virulence factors putative positive transcription regulator BvgA [compost metagenome]
MSRILIVDEQPVTRHAVRLLMESESHEVVGEADSGPQALQLARSLMPDLVILELSIPGLGGLEVIQRLIALEQGFNILVLTTQDSKYFAGRCLQAGARGFVSKQQDPHELKAAVKALLNGQSYFPSHVLKGVGQEQPSGAVQTLSVRELTVLQLLARGFSNIAISEQLAISDKTVSTYKVRLMQKLQASSLVELVDIARRSGLIEAAGNEADSAQGASLEPGQREQLELLQKMIDAVPGTLTVRDTQGRLLICNQAFVDITGVSREELRGTRYTDLPSYAEEDGRAIQENYLQAVAQGAPTVFDRVFDDRRLGRRVLTLWAKPLHAADGQLIGMLCGSQNHSERDELLRELHDTVQRMEAEERVRMAFAATMSREVRGVFRGISAMIDLALTQPVIDDTQREPLKVAHAMTTRLHGLFSDLQDFNRLQAGRVHLTPQPQDLRSLLEACVAGYREQAEAKGLALELQIGRLQESRVWVDAKRLRQVLDNLLSNALKFTDSGGVVCRLGSTGCGKGQVEVTLEVEDSGIGIEESELEHLFEPFRQLPDQQRLLRGGSGLGLSLCHQLLAMMGGSIVLSSQPGHGTRATVRLVLPVAGA